MNSEYKEYLKLKEQITIEDFEFLFLSVSKDMVVLKDQIETEIEILRNLLNIDKEKADIYGVKIYEHQISVLYELAKKYNIVIDIHTTPPQTQIEQYKTNKIDWKKDERLIPYLIHLLNENGFIKEKNQFAFIEKHFTANGKPIKRENIKTNYNQADYLNKPINKSPKEIKQMNDFIEQLNSILNSLE